MKSFTDYLDSEYIGAYNHLQPKQKAKSIVVYVESEEDIAFWRSILYVYENKQLKFEIKLPSNTSLSKGKGKALARSGDIFELVTGELGKYMLICVDSDYDYLLYQHYELPSKQETAKLINENPYIFQTYAYSIENLKCFSESLHNVCVQTTLNDTEKIDFVALMELYSATVYELFLWNLLFYGKGEDNHFTLTTFCEQIKILSEPRINDFGKEALANVKEKVKLKVEELETNFPEYKKEISEFAQKMENLGLTSKNSYLFIQGHTLFDNVVLMFLKPICKQLKSEWLTNIEMRVTNSAKETPNFNEKETLVSVKNAYRNNVGKVEDEVVKVLSNNTEFKNCFLFDNIKQDIENYISLI